MSLSFIRLEINAMTKRLLRMSPDSRRLATAQEARLKSCCAGSTIPEVAPALLILILVVLMPLVNLLALTFSFGAGWYLNFAQAREAALTAVVRDNAVSNQSAVEAAVRRIRRNWAGTGIGRFTGATRLEENVELSATPEEGPLRYLATTTTMTVQPILRVPLFIDVPGLSAPVAFAYVSQRPVEDVR